MNLSRIYQEKFVLVSFLLTFLLIFLVMQSNDSTFPRPSIPLVFVPHNPSGEDFLLEPLSEEGLEMLKVLEEEDNIGDYNDTDALIDKILSRQREKIDKDLMNYKYHPLSPAVGYEDLQLEYGNAPVRNMIVTTWRSGSTFLGDMLLSHPASYYHYEPLLPYGINQVRKPPLSDSALKDLKNLFNCDYSKMDPYLSYARSHDFLLSHNFPIWNICKGFEDLCFNPKFLSSMCKLFPFQVIKTVRLRVALVEDILKSKSAQVLLLVRDPRGTMQSRNHRDWCPSNPDCADPELLCKDLVSDFYAAKKLFKKYPNTFKVIRYEDLSLNIYNQSKVLYDFFHLSYHPRLKFFLDSHTSFKKGGVSSTYRDSKTAPIHWRKDLEWEVVDYVQTVCHKAIDLWGYNMAKNSSLLRTFNPINEVFDFSKS